MTSNILETLILDLPLIKDHHKPSHLCYGLIKKIAIQETTHLFSDHSENTKPFGPFGKIAFPYFKMGAIDSVDLFGLDELIIFSFYWINRHRYKKVLDIGGNLGLHSIVLDRCGYDVRVYEPDPIHFDLLTKNLKLNACTSVVPHNTAVSDKSGTAEFVRVFGNTTSSHLEGSKQPYGELEKFRVPLENIDNLISSADLMKMDVEGHEKAILLATTREQWEGIDALVEIGSAENAKAVFDHLKKIKVSAFAQKIGWKQVKIPEDMPTSYRDGTLFITIKEEMPWTPLILP